MAHYAFLDENNKVIEVIVGKDEDDIETLPDEFSDWEEYYLTKRPEASDCKRTSYNTANNQHLGNGEPFRGNYAGIGYFYDATNDVFYPTMPEIDGKTFELDNSIWNWVEVTE